MFTISRLLVDKVALVCFLTAFSCNETNKVFSVPVVKIKIVIYRRLILGSCCQVTDAVNTSTAVVPVLPAPGADAAKARTGSRSSPKTASRVQGTSRPGVGGAPAASEGTKRNQNKEQAERRNQAIIQLRRLLVQGNRRVEALATVVQHLFSTVRCNAVARTLLKCRLCVSENTVLC